MRALAVATVILAASAGFGGCGNSGGNAAAPIPQLPTTGVLPHVLLHASQVGAGYVLINRPDGQGVAGFVTLDLCGHHFASEALRTDRLQVDYRKPTSPVQVSNEVVTYRAGGAERALAELRDAAARCPTKPVRSTVQGVGLLQEHVRRVTHQGFLATSIALEDTVRQSHQRHASTGMLVYQVSGNLLSAVYTHGGSIAAQRAVALRAGDGAARNLRSAKP